MNSNQQPMLHHHHTATNMNYQAPQGQGPGSGSPCLRAEGSIQGSNNMIETHHQHHHHSSNNWGVKCDPSSDNSSSYGASSNQFNPYHQQQQQQNHCYYSQQQQYHHHHHQHHQHQGGVAVPDSTDYNNASASSTNNTNNSNSTAYYNNNDHRGAECGGRTHQYYPGQGPGPPDFQHQQQYSSNGGSGSCSMQQQQQQGNFYGYYNNQNNQASANTSYYNNGGEDGAEQYMRNQSHPLMNNNSYHQHHENGYFYQEQIQSQRYHYNNSHPHHSHASHTHHSHTTIIQNNHPPFRRKSMESYISEGYSNNKGYAISSSSMQQQQQSNFMSPPHQQQQPHPQQPQTAAPYCSPAPSPSSSTSPAAQMIKRECLSNPSSSADWVRNSVSNSSANNCSSTSGDVVTAPHSLQHRQTNYGNYGGHNTTNYPTNDGGEQYHHFKSCAYEGAGSGCGSSASETKFLGTYSKPGSVKHRSLSIPANLPSSQQSSQAYNVNNNATSQSRGSGGGCGNEDISSLQFPQPQQCMQLETNSTSMEKVDGESSSYSENYPLNHTHHNNENIASDLSGDSFNNEPISGESSSESPFEIKNQRDCDEQGEEIEEHHRHVVGTRKGCDEEDEDEEDDDMDSSSLLHEFDVDDIPESDMIIAETDSDAGEEQDLEDVDDDDDDEEIEPHNPRNNHLEPCDDESEEEVNANPPSNNNVISTTTTSSDVNPVPQEEDGSENSNCSQNSNTSFTSALFSLKRSNSGSGFASSASSNSSNECRSRSNSLGALEGTIGNLTNASCEPQGQSQGHGHCDSGISLSFSLNSSGCPTPKLLKRSLSETDKEDITLLSVFGSSDEIQTTEIERIKEETDESLNITGTIISKNTQSGCGRGVSVPKGWKREISFNKDQVTVCYVSPSDTKLKNLDELKNYICSDGTCKCGLSCPLLIEAAFSFDPKVITVSSVDKKRSKIEDDDLMYLTGFKEHPEDDEEVLEDEPKTILCNHYKRKIPKSEDSPLISSTRDDLGEAPAKKRRTSDSSLSLPGNATPTHQSLTPTLTPPLPSLQTSVLLTSEDVANGGEHLLSQGNNKEINKESSSISGALSGRQSQGLSITTTVVPCSQQSPDTTTQTPQTEMSPASSISSEPVLRSSSLSSRSTPTPPNSTSSSLISTSGSNCSNGKASKSSSFTPPITTLSTSSNNKKTFHHLTHPSKSKSPCPNVDVRQIPLEQNKPPPLVPSSSSSSGAATTSSTISTSITTNNANSSTITSNLNPTTLLQPTPTLIDLGNGNLGLLPSSVSGGSISFYSSPTQTIVSTSAGSGSTVATSSSHLSTVMSMNGLNGFTISPIMQQGTTTMNIFNSPLTLPLEVQKLLGAQAQGGSDGSQTFLPQFQTCPPFMLSMQPQTQQLITPFQSSAQQATTTTVTATSTISTASADSTKLVEEKDHQQKRDDNTSPMQLTQDVVHGVGDEDKEKDNNEVIKKETENETDSSVVEAKLKSESEESKPKESSENNSNPDQKVPTTSSSCSTTTTASTISQQQQQGQIILHQGQQGMVSSNSVSFTTTTPTSTDFGQMRYPIIQTIQPFFSGGPLIISSSPQTQQQQPNHHHHQQQIQPHPGGPPTQGSNQAENNQNQSQPSFVYSQDSIQMPLMQDSSSSTLTMPLMYDPNLGNLVGIPPLTLTGSNCLPFQGLGQTQGQGGKKKKKRLSKKQQQQQAQLQLQQQLLIQQIQAQAQQQAALNAAFPFTILPQSFPLMNTVPFFQSTPTILTLPNLILNPADGTLFLQPSAPLSQTGQTQQQQHQLQQPQLLGSRMTIAPKDSKNDTDDLRRNNPTPDSSTGDVLSLNILNNGGNNSSSTSTTSSCPSPLTGMTTPTTTPIPSPIIGLPTIIPVTGAKGGKVSLKSSSSRTVSSSGGGANGGNKRVFHQKQILPKIDSTTSSLENN